MTFPSNNFGRSETLQSPTQSLAISKFISRTYGWMFLGLLVTAGVSFAVASSESAIRMIIENRGVFMIAILLEFGLVMFLTAAQQRLTAMQATLGFLAYSALNGVTLSVVFLAYTMTSVANVFLICAAMFGGLSLFGTVTKRDLTGMGSFFMMGLWGMILVGLVNMFVQSSALSLGMSVVGVLVFSGLTAWDAQRIKALAFHYVGGGYGNAAESKGSIYGALSLYLNFINLFLSLLRLFGSRRN